MTGRGLSKLLRLSCGLTISRIMGNNRRRWLRKASNTIEQGLQIQHRLRATQIQKGRGYKYRRPRGTKHLKSKDASCKQNRWAVAKRAVVVKNCAFASLQLADEALVPWCWCCGGGRRRDLHKAALRVAVPHNLCNNRPQYGLPKVSYSLPSALPSIEEEFLPRDKGSSVVTIPTHLYKGPKEWTPVGCFIFFIFWPTPRAWILDQC